MFVCLTLYKKENKHNLNQDQAFEVTIVLEEEVPFVMSGHARCVPRALNESKQPAGLKMTTLMTVFSAIHFLMSSYLDVFTGHVLHNSGKQLGCIFPFGNQLKTNRTTKQFHPAVFVTVSKLNS